MITRQQLQLINRKQLGYPLDIAEKDYYLALAVKLIAESSLGKVLVFKGGTAIHHCYLPQYRFSEDLDFTSLDRDLDLQAVVETLEATGDFIVKKLHESPATIKIERLGYQGILGQSGAIKIEIDRKQNVVLPPAFRTYANPWNIAAAIQTMQLNEVLAEKIRASATRARYRDFYDLYLLLEQPSANVAEALELLKHKEIRAIVSPAQMATNWRQAQNEANDDLRTIYCSRKLDDQAIAQMLAGFNFEPLFPRA